MADVCKHAGLNFLLRRLEHDASLATKCFDSNYMNRCRPQT